MSSSSSEFSFLSLCQCPSRSSSLSPSSSIYPSPFRLFIKFAGGEEPELIGSVLKLFIMYERYGLQPYSQISTTEGANWISQRRHSLGRGKSRSQIFFLVLRGSEFFLDVGLLIHIPRNVFLQGKPSHISIII